MTVEPVKPQPAGRSMPFSRLGVIRLSLLAMAALTIASWLTIFSSGRLQAAGFFRAETLDRAWTFLGDLAGSGSQTTPAFLQLDQWAEKAELAMATLAMSVLGIGIAAVVAFSLFMFGARNVMLGDLAPYGRSLPRLVFVLVRAFFTLTRAIPELVWALIVVFAFAPGILAGAVALGIHNGGVLGRLSAEVVEGLDQRPMRSLRSAGAGYLQMILFGVLPEALPKFLTYLLYRWEIIIRTTVVVGFVAAGGLGTDFRLAMSFFRYTEITLILVWYLILVLAVDLISASLRRLVD